jgi:hypothetical protein
LAINSNNAETSEELKVYAKSGKNKGYPEKSPIIKLPLNR